MRLLTLLAVVPFVLAACGAPAPTGGGRAPAAIAAGSGVCPDPDPVRDGPLVDAIRTGSVGPIDATLARNPSDARAVAAKAVVDGRTSADPNQLACFAPYF